MKGNNRWPLFYLLEWWVGREGVWGRKNHDDGCKDGKGGFGPSREGEIGEKGRRLQYHEGTSLSIVDKVNIRFKKWK
jgi:hypothetical protein